MIAGSFLYLSEYQSWFALKNYRIEAQSQELERRLWEVFPKRCLTFWPYLLRDARGFSEFLEKDMPVKVDTFMERLGRFTTKIEWLGAWVRVQWLGQLWCISRDGKMWRYDERMPNNDGVGRLVWKIPNDDETYSGNMSGVFDSPISTEVIASFLEEFQNRRWFNAANDITWERRAGMDLFILNLTHSGQHFELYLQREKYAGQDVGYSLDELFSRLINEGGNYIIDATYEGKILLRKL